MSKRIGIFTPYSIDPVHVRLAMVKSMLEQAGHNVTIIQPDPQLRRTFLNRFGFGFVNLSVARSVAATMRALDVVYIQDLELLPLIITAKRLGKNVVYETLDNNVSLKSYSMLQDGFARWQATILRAVFEFVETRTTAWWADAVIVNSPALKTYFRDRAHCLPYSSPFESLPTPEPVQKPPALLYLGLFNRAKGADNMLAIHDQWNIPLYIVGDIPENAIAAQVDQRSDVVFYPRMASDALREQLIDLRTQFSLIGLSLIKPIHHSYATQYANKDIDYLALGIPVIGNHRGPTGEVIDAGCGVFVDDSAAVSRLIADRDFFTRTVSTCRNYYDTHFSQRKYRDALLKIVTPL